MSSGRLSRSLERLRVAGLLTCLDLRQGSLLDQGNLGNNFTPTSGAPLWTRNAKGLGCSFGVTADYISCGNPANLQVTQATMIFAGSRTLSPAAFQGMFVRLNAFNLMFNNSAEPRQFGAYDYGGGAWRASTKSLYNDGLPHFYAASFKSGVAGGTRFYCDGVPCGTAQVTIANQLGVWRFGMASGGQGFGGIGNLGIVVIAALSDSDIAEIYTDYLNENINPAPPTRVYYQYPALDNAGYAAKGIVLDTDLGSEMNGATRRIREFTGAYPGAILGVPISSPQSLTSGGEGSRFSGVADYLSFGDVTQLNGQADYTICFVICASAQTNAVGTAIFGKRDVAGNNREDLMLLTNAPGPYILRYREDYAAGAGTAYIDSNAAVLRAGCLQVVTIRKQGASAQMWVDGELVPVTQTGTFSATTSPLLAGTSLRVAGAVSSLLFAGDILSTRLYTSALSSADIRAWYLQWARRLDWQCSGEDTPVSLVASLGAGYWLGAWEIVGGSWKVSEDSTGKRWNELVTTGTLATPSSPVFGTWVATLARQTQTEWMFIAAEKGRYNVSATQSGYWIAMDTNGALYLIRGAGGAIAAILWNTANGYVAAGVAYDICVTRRPSDGLFTTWIRGGAYTSWTLVTVIAGANPVADANITSSRFANIYAATAATKALIFNPRGNDQFAARHPVHYVGQLNPTLREVP